MFVGVKCELTGIAIDYRLIPIAFSELKPQSCEKPQTAQSENKVLNTIKFVSERR